MSKKLLQLFSDKLPAMFLKGFIFCDQAMG